MKSRRSLMWILILFFPLNGACAGNTSRKVSNVELQELTPGQVSNSKVVQVEANKAGCDLKPALTRNERIAVIAKVVFDVRNEYRDQPQALNDYTVYRRVATFAATEIPKSAPFSAVDDVCYADFYRAQQMLAAGKDSRAETLAKAWIDCLEATFTDRAELARPYLSCFVPSAR